MSTTIADEMTRLAHRQQIEMTRSQERDLAMRLRSLPILLVRMTQATDQFLRTAAASPSFRPPPMSYLVSERLLSSYAAVLTAVREERDRQVAQEGAVYVPSVLGDGPRRGLDETATALPMQVEARLLDQLIVIGEQCMTKAQPFQHPKSGKACRRISARYLRCLAVVQDAPMLGPWLPGGDAFQRILEDIRQKAAVPTGRIPHAEQEDAAVRVSSLPPDSRAEQLALDILAGALPPPVRHVRTEKPPAPQAPHAGSDLPATPSRKDQPQEADVDLFTWGNA